MIPKHKRQEREYLKHRGQQIILEKYQHYTQKLELTPKIFNLLDKTFQSEIKKTKNIYKNFNISKSERQWTHTINKLKKNN